MSTSYHLKTPQSRQSLEEIGILFHDGEEKTRNNETIPYTWIVNNSKEEDITNYLHPNIGNDNMVYGWTRYRGNSSDELSDILDGRLIEYCSEYDLDFDVPVETLLNLFDLDEDNEELSEALMEFIYDNLDMLDFVWSSDKRQFLLDFWKEEGKQFEEILQIQTLTREFLKDLVESK
tara:strand:+ start:295 stop:825 length:531 start_codon:yes stop_codon:yes gene_type:complete